MNYDKLTIKAQEALQEASSFAQKNDQTQVELEHILLALVEQEGGIVAAHYRKIGADPELISQEARKLVASKPKVYGDAAQLYFSPAASRVLAKAETEAASLKDEFVSTEHILIAMTQAEGPATDILRRSGITKEAILSALKSVRGNARVTDQSPEEKYQVLDKYCRDLTALARQEKLDPVIGRDEEIRRVMQVLSRRTKTTRFLSVNRGSVKPPLWKALPAVLWRGMSPRGSRTSGF